MDSTLKNSIGICSVIKTRENVMNDDYMKILHAKFKHKANELLFSQGKSFTMETDEQRHFYGTILRYFARNQSFYESNLINKDQASLKKGLLVLGDVGAGKSFVFKVMHELNDYIKISANQFSSVQSTDLAFQFNKGGIEAVDRYFIGQRYFDDLGSEEKGSHYGHLELMRIILEKRHELFLSTGKKTFMTSNYSEQELIDRYGNRAESRLYEMFNIIVVTGQDRRKTN